MSVTIDLTEQQPIRFGLTGADEVIQNVRTILSTIVGSVPLARGLGIDPSILDEPIPIARARLSSSIVSAILEYEPRATVTEIDFQEDHTRGLLVPIIKIEPASGEVSF